MIRKVLAIWLVTVVVLLEAAFLLDAIGVAVSPAFAAWGILLIGPSLAVLALGPHLQLNMDDGSGTRWAVIGLLVFGGWATAYFLVGHLLPTDRVTHLPTWALSWVPVVPAFSLLYVAVHPFNLVPWFLVRDHEDLRRLGIAMAMMLALSVVAWIAVPIGTERLMPGDPSSSLGTWVLSLVYVYDPPVNCFPSAHCAMAMCVALSLNRTHRGLGLWAIGTCGAIAISTLMTHQHYLADVAVGLLLGGGAWHFAGRLTGQVRHTLWLSRST